MAANQAKAGRQVHAFDLSQAAVDKAVAAGCRPAASVAEAVKDADVVITMLPAGAHVRAVYGDEVLAYAPKSALLVPRLGRSVMLSVVFQELTLLPFKERSHSATTSCMGGAGGQFVTSTTTRPPNSRL
jgi:ornithine cyclodeaminase/alanine dehydrogenase-like protein (mu-crystallin family)